MPCDGGRDEAMGAERSTAAMRCCSASTRLLLLLLCAEAQLDVDAKEARDMAEQGAEEQVAEPVRAACTAGVQQVQAAVLPHVQRRLPSGEEQAEEDATASKPCCKLSKRSTRAAPGP